MPAAILPDPDLVDALEAHTLAAHAEQPRRFGSALAVVQSMTVLEASAVLVQAAIAEQVGRPAEAFVGRFADEIGHYAAPKLADAVSAIVAEFGAKAEAALGGY